ncbi:MFS transporter [Brenneria corticis]|uniref:MFS transporter n=1 Tax=Brenneria corticis TaxID=2173106 RepID=UPI001AEFAA27|nr:MFS transporter [Brenneria sp. CFCC 11842]
MMLFTVVFSVGQAIGPMAAGWIADAYNLNRSLWFGLALLLAGALLPLLATDRKRFLERAQSLVRGEKHD